MKCCVIKYDDIIYIKINIILFIFMINNKKKSEIKTNYHCNICNKYYASKSSLCNHNKKYHNNNNNNDWNLIINDIFNHVKNKITT